MTSVDLIIANNKLCYFLNNKLDKEIRRNGNPQLNSRYGGCDDVEQLRRYKDFYVLASVCSQHRSTVTMRSEKLALEDVSLHYETRGSGPSLVLVPAALGTAHQHASIAEQLAAKFKVITYDRRGFDRSTPVKAEAMNDPNEVVAENARDLASLIRHVSPDAPAYLFGSCHDGVIVEELLQAYPDLVRLVLVHEPAEPGLLPPAE